MRTAIYVYQPSTVTINATDPRDARVEIHRYNQPSDARAIGTLQLTPGIYMMLSNDHLQVTGLDGEIIALPNNKDDWPEVKPRALALEPGASPDSIKQFFVLAKSIDV